MGMGVCRGFRNKIYIHLGTHRGSEDLLDLRTFS
jgi:hypothetical protein